MPQMICAYYKCPACGKEVRWAGMFGHVQEASEQDDEFADAHMRFEEALEEHLNTAWDEAQLQWVVDNCEKAR